MDAEDAAGVLAGRARLAAKAGREAGVADGQRRLLEDVVGVQRGERDLRGADQVEVVVGQRVDLLLGVGEEPGAVQRGLAHQDGRYHGLEPVLPGALERVAHQRELEQHEVALEVGEARARHARRGLHVDARSGELEVVAAAAAGLADLPQHRVLRRGVRIREVGQGGQRGVALGLHPTLLVGQGATALGERCERLALFRRGRTGAPAAGLVELGLHLLELLRELAPARVELQHAVEPALVAAPRERRAHGVGVAADQLEIEDGGPRSRLEAGGR